MHRKLCAVKLKSTKLLTCLSTSTICLLIFTSIVIITVISITPIIILGLGQINAGQRDLILKPVDSSSTFLNNTKIAQLSGYPSMPRQSVFISINNDNARGTYMDFQLEKAMHLGSLPITTQPNSHTHYIYLHSQFGYREGQSVNVKIQNYQSIFKAIKSSLLANKPLHYPVIVEQIDGILQEGIDLSADFEVAGVYDMAYGKFPLGSVGGTAYLNIRNAFHYIVNTVYTRHQYNSARNKVFLHYVNNELNYADFSSQVTINLPDRIDVYLNSNYQQTYYTLSEFAEQVLTSIGMFSVDSQIPIGANLIAMSYFGMFIGVVLKLIIFSLFILSILMMNNMLNVGIDRKNFDFAVLKTMGANRFFIVSSLLIDSLKYVIVGNCVAFPFAYWSLGSISEFFVDFFGYRYDVKMTWTAVLGSLFIGVLVPIFSSLAPIWGVINNDLAQNLNPVRNKTQSIKTEIYVEGAQFPVGKLIFGTLALTFGLMIYYFLPKALITKNIGLLLFVFFAILVGLLLGLIILSYSFQYVFEKLIAYLTLFWVNKTDFMLTMKNLSAHRFRNRRSSLLYALSVSFVIFVSVGLSIQMQTISEQLLKQHGTYIQVSSPTDSLNKQYFDELLATTFSQDVIDWAYQTARIDYQLTDSQNVGSVMYSDKARLYLMKMKMYGVSSNYLKVMPAHQLNIAKSYAYEPYDPYEFLYTPDGYMTCTISEYAAHKFNALGSNRQFLINYYQPASLQRRPLNISTVFSKRAGLGYSKFSFGPQHLGVSFDTYLTLSGLRSYAEIPYSKLKLQVKDPEHTSKLANRLRKEISLHSMAEVWDYSQVKTTINRIQNLLDNITNFLLVLVLLISFFSLVTTSYINIVNQSTEIAILLTLGYQRGRVIRIYVYEAFVLIVNSCLIGMGVGIFVAWMMGLQRELFGDFPVQIEIKGIWIIGVAAVVSSVLSTLKPVRDLFKRSINQIFLYS